MLMFVHLARQGMDDYLGRLSAAAHEVGMAYLHDKVSVSSQGAIGGQAFASAFQN